MMKFFLALIFLSTLPIGQLKAADLYTRNATSGGDWDDTNTWTLNTDGSDPGCSCIPTENDNVFILSGHTVTLDGDIVTNNPSAVTTANAEGLSAHPTSGDDAFVHRGNIVVESGATLQKTGTPDGDDAVIFTGESHFFGTISSTFDFYNIDGEMTFHQGASVTVMDDLILGGASTTLIDISLSSFDDIYLVDDMAFLCSTGCPDNCLGDIALGGGPDPEIQLFGSADEANQICAGFTVSGCTVGIPCPFTGTASFTLPFASGPGGFGTTDGNSNLVLWLNANTINLTDGSNLLNWRDQSGYANDASADGSNEPVFLTNQINGFPAIQYTAGNSDFLRVTNDASLDAATLSLFSPGNITNSSDNDAGIVSKLDNNAPSQGYALNRNESLEEVRFLIDAEANNSSGGITFGTNAIMSGIYDKVNVELFLNETSQGQDAYTPDITASGRDLLIGALEDNTTPASFLDGDIAEIIVVSRNVNSAERIIINNYLSAKYNITLNANDFYAGDDNANGDFDFDVKGVGTESDGSQTIFTNSAGLTVEQAGNFETGDYVLAGHSNVTNDVNTTDIGGVTGLEGRWERIWFFDVTDGGTALTANITFDFSNAGINAVPGGGVDYRLLYRAGQTGNWTDAGTATSVSGDKVNFSGNGLTNGTGYYTLGSLDLNGSPLPIELISFEAKSREHDVQLLWSTASETNNAIFTLERSRNLKDWGVIGIVDGAGSSDVQIDYDFIDRSPLSGLNYYRLKQTDFDGSFEYSPVISAVFQTEAIKVYPNPTRNFVTIDTKSDIQWELVEFVNNLGTPVPFQHFSDKGLSIIEFGKIPSGLYLLHFPLREKSLVVNIIVD